MSEQHKPTMSLFIGKPEYLAALDEYYLGYNDYKKGIVREDKGKDFWYSMGLADGLEEEDSGV